MKSFDKIFVGTAGLQLLSKGLIAISGILFARLLGPSEYGQYAYVLSIITLATLPVVAGVPNLLIREVANYQLEEKWGLLSGIISWAQKTVLLSSLLVVTCIVAGIYLEIFKDEVSALLCFGIWLIPFRGLLVQQGAIINGYRRPVRAQLSSLLFVPVITLTILAIYLAIGVKLDAESALTIMIVASIVAFILSKALLSSVSPEILKGFPREFRIKRWFSSMLPFALVTVLVSFNTELATFFLGWLGSAESVAFFKVAMQATVLISIGLSSVNAIIMPSVARYFKQGDIEKTQNLLTESVRLSTFFSIPVAHHIW